MLSSLHIENIAVIYRLDIDFCGGFTAFTGETGAGKSIIIDSIGLLLGAKADKDLIRHGESYALVSGLFTSLSSDLLSKCASLGLGIDDDGALLIQRSIGADGKSTVRINGRAVSLTLLKSISGALLSIHGQNDTRTLEDSAVQLSLIDTYARLSPEKEKYKIAYDEYVSVRNEISEVEKAARSGARMRELLQYQIRDIDALGLKSGEEDALIDKKVKIRASERIGKNAGFVFRALKGAEKGSVAFLLDRSIHSLEAISDVIPQGKEYAERLRDFLFGVEDIAEEVCAITEDMDEDPTEKLNEIESRLDAISKLKRKYGATVEEVLAFRDKSAEELEKIDNSEEILQELEKKKKTLYQSALSLADVLHQKRAEACRVIEQSVKDVLDYLDMPKVVFFTEMDADAENGERVLGPTGYDRVNFCVSANRGALPLPIGKIASGGELARIMLALKCTLSDRSGVGTLIFDEIDAGVSGKTARKIGMKMRELSSTAQIFVVTHSAQIAGLAKEHLKIGKSDVDGKTQTSVTILDREGRIDELSRILGGIEVTQSQRDAARDMLDIIEI